jgi:Tfp pilus assembly protein PilO
MTPKQPASAKVKKVEHPKTPTSINDKLATKNFLTIMIAVSIGVVLIGGYFIYRFTGAYVKQANEIKAQDQLISSLKKKQAALEKLKPNYAAITQKGANNLSDADLILRAVPTSEDYKRLIASIEQIGKESNVRVSSVTQSTSTAPAPAAAGSGSKPATTDATVLGFTVSIEGQYDKIFTFLENTERSARVMNFTNMTLSGNSGTVSASLSMKTYWRPPASITSTMEPLK